MTCAQLDPSAHAPCTSTTFFALTGLAASAGAVCTPSDPARTPATIVSVRKMLIGLLRDRLDKRLARSSSKFEESGGFVTQPHGDVTRARPCKIADQECTEKPRFPSGVFIAPRYSRWLPAARIRSATLSGCEARER